MSAIAVLPVVLPVVAPAVGGAAVAVWPVVATAAAAVASSLGFVSVGAGTKTNTENMTEVDVSVENAAEVAADVGIGDELVFAKEDIQLVVARSTTGQVSLKVRGCNRTEQELRVLGKQLVNKLTQQYAYHRLVTELKQRDFNVVAEEMEKDGTVRLQVRTFQS